MSHIINMMVKSWNYCRMKIVVLEIDIIVGGLCVCGLVLFFLKGPNIHSIFIFQPRRLFKM